MNNPKRHGSYFAYMVQCKYGTYYSGWTNDIEKRLGLHNEGKGAKYLRGRGPVQLVYKEEFTSALDAQAKERFLKKLTKQQKKNLIKNCGS